jgi:Competence protein CoiA-like family
MSNHFQMGAYNKDTGEHESPIYADKKYKYSCPECCRDVIFKKGKIMRPHFSHMKSDKPCLYYDKPSESQLHKEAKLLLTKMLKNHIPISIYRKCQCSSKYGSNYKNTVTVLNMNSKTYSDTWEIITEYKFIHNESCKSADVACVDNGNIVHIFEICHTHKTKEMDRPEPWFEFNARNLIEIANESDGKFLKIECLRNFDCEYCVAKKLREKIKDQLVIKVNEIMNSLYHDEFDDYDKKKIMNGTSLFSIEYLKHLQSQSVKLGMKNVADIMSYFEKEIIKQIDMSANSIREEKQARENDEKWINVIRDTFRIELNSIVDTKYREEIDENDKMILINRNESYCNLHYLNHLRSHFSLSQFSDDDIITHIKMDITQKIENSISSLQKEKKWWEIQKKERMEREKTSQLEKERSERNEKRREFEMEKQRKYLESSNKQSILYYMK